MATVHELYGGAWELKFSGKSHRYAARPKGSAKWIEVPGVTSILSILAKPALTYWAASMAASYVLENTPAGVPLTREEIEEIAEGARSAHRKASRQAKGVGSEVHDWIEQYWVRKKLDKPAPPLPASPEARSAVEGFLGWVEDHDIEVLDVEVPVLYVEWDRPVYAGKTDLLARIDGRVTLVDYKTSKGFYLEYPLQLAAYRHAVIHATRTWVRSVQVVRIDKETGVFEEGPVLEWEELEVYTKAWLSLLDTYRTLKQAEAAFSRW